MFNNIISAISSIPTISQLHYFSPSIFCCYFQLILHFSCLLHRQLSSMPCCIFTFEPWANLGQCPNPIYTWIHNGKKKRMTLWGPSRISEKKLVKNLAVNFYTTRSYFSVILSYQNFFQKNRVHWTSSGPLFLNVGRRRVIFFFFNIWHITDRQPSIS